jgi:hypothetical protein
MTRIALLLTLTATLAAGAAHADQSPACDRAALIRAERGAVLAEAQYEQAQTWSQQNRALALVQATVEQARTARALCTVVTLPELAAKADPFDDSDPFQAVAPAPAWTPPVEVPGIPYLVDAVVEAQCPGVDCPVVWAGTGEVTP